MSHLGAERDAATYFHYLSLSPVPDYTHVITTVGMQLEETKQVITIDLYRKRDFRIINLIGEVT
jgi:hypothetical protein